MMKPALGLAALLAVTSIVLGGCSNSTPGLDNPINDAPHSPLASVIKLIPNTRTAHTTGNVYLTAEVYDANGRAIEREQVTFKKISGVGTLSAGTAVTDDTGRCQVTLASGQDGYALVEASTTNATGVYVRDAEFVYFNHCDGQAPNNPPGFSGCIVKPAALLLSIDSDLDGVFDEPVDMSIREAGIKATLRAQFLDNNDNPVPNGTIEFYSDLYTYHQLVFPEGSTRVTDQNGYAFVDVQTSVAVTEKRSFIEFIAYESLTKATASLQLGTVAVGTISVVSVPSLIEEGSATTGSATVTAFVLNELGQPVEDGTLVRFSTNQGFFTSNGATTQTVDAATSGGSASATFTGGQLGVATITGTAGGRSDTAQVEVVAVIGDPVVVPESQNILPLSQATFQILGGAGPFQVFTDQPDLVSVTVNGREFTIVNTLEPGADTVTITVVDSAGRTATGTLTIGSIAFQIDPSDAHLPGGLSMRFTVYGAQPPYEIFSNRCECVNFCGGGGFSPSGTGTACVASVGLSGATFIVCTNRDVNCDTDATTLTAVDITGQTATTTLTLDEPIDLSITPDDVTIPVGAGVLDLRFFVQGGLAPYRVDINFPNFAQLGGTDIFLGVIYPTTDQGGGLNAGFPVSVGTTGVNYTEFDLRVDTSALDPGGFMWALEPGHVLVYDSNGNLVTATLNIEAPAAAPAGP